LNGTILESLFPKILLTNTTWWACASRLAMAFSRAGCDVAAVCPSRGHPLLKTSSVRKTFPYRALHPLSSLETAIGEYKPQLVVPCDDRAVQHLHELYAAGPGASGGALSALIQRSLGSPASYPIVSNRLDLLEAAREEGIRVPETSAIRSGDDIKSLPARQAPPWVVKADGSWGGHGVRISSDLSELEHSRSALMKPLSATRAVKRLMVDRDAFWLRTWWKHSRSNVIAQSYIPGNPANCAVCCWEGKVLAAIYVEVVQAQGDTGSATVVRLVEHPEMEFAAERIAKRLGLSGFFGLDFVIEEGSGDAYLIEMNPRCTPLCHLQLGTGQDLAEALWRQLTGAPWRETPTITRNDTIAYFPQAWHWDSEHELLGSSFQDVPWEDPELVQELLQLPWPDRGILARVSSRIRNTTFADRRSKAGDFEAPEPVLADPARPAFESSSRGYSMAVPSVVPLRNPGEGEPLFLIHGVEGKVSRFHKLVNYLDPQLSVYGIQSQALLGERIALTRLEDLASYYLREVRALQPSGPYHLLGFSFGGLIAFEMARQLHSEGQQLGMVGMIDNRKMTPAAEAGDASPSLNVPRPWLEPMRRRLNELLGPKGLSYGWGKLRARGLRSIYSLLDALDQPIPAFLLEPGDINWFAARRYVPQFYPGRVTLFQAVESPDASRPPNDAWGQLCGEGAEIREISGHHENLFVEPQVQMLAKEITECLAESYWRAGAAVGAR
jgi:thioesterase domain-containing protein/glutathione synthase/RimK-type ligase-like ATP-grasp enzyme